MSVSTSKFTEQVKAKFALINADITTDRTSSYVSPAGYKKIVALLTADTVAATKNATVQLLQATSDAGAGAKALTTPVEFVAPSGGATVAIMAEADIDQLDVKNNFKFVAVKVTSDNSTAVIGSATFLLADADYRPV